MITIESPSMALNDSRAAVSYTMDHTVTVQPTTTIGQLATSIVNKANSITGGVIKNLILTAHGLPGFFQIGTGLDINSMNPLSSINGKVFKIWFRGCLIARIIDSQTAGQGDGSALQQYGITSGNGHNFISAFARLTGCYVVAPTEMQVSNRTSYTNGVMDSYEGLVLSYNPQGVISWQRRYPSIYGIDPQTGRATAPNRE